MRNKELLKIDALNVSDRVKQLKMNHVFKIRNQTSPSYMFSNFNRLNANNSRMTIRASQDFFGRPEISAENHPIRMKGDLNLLRMEGIL